MEKGLPVILSETPVSEYRYFESIGSTNDEALNWIEHGAPDFALVIADEQTKGRGRFERPWITRPHTSLAFTLILTSIDPDPRLVPLYAPLGGIAVQEAVQNLLGLDAHIKWPNDVLVDGGKFCGILVEAAWQGADLRGVAMGIGVNINPAAIPAESAQNFPATSLESACGHPIDRLVLLQKILISINQWRSQLGSAAFMQRWQERLAFKGERVNIEHSEKPSIIGTMVGVDDSGQLILVEEGGTELHIAIGDVHLRPDSHKPTGGNDAG